MSQPKNCAHCGAEAELRDDGDWQVMEGNMNWWIACNECGVMAGGYWTAEEALADWDSRVKQECTHPGYKFEKHGRCCHKCGEFITDFGD